MKALIRSLLANFKWYRKRKGGVWYKVYDPHSVTGMSGYMDYWKQEPPDDWPVIDVERYS